MVQQLQDKLKELIQPIVSSLGYELWGCVLHYAGKRTVLRVYIELMPDISLQRVAVSLGDCGKVSREISAIFDVEDVIKGSYTLEVSSPGMDRQLFTVEQYQRFVGSLIALHLLANEQGRRNYKGRLMGVDNASITLQVDDAEVIIPLASIDKANIIPEF